MDTVYLGLGSNLGDRPANLRRALKELGCALEIHEVSSVYESEAAGFLEQPDFLNMVVRGKTDLAPDRLLAVAQRIERHMGRRWSFRNAPRPIDIDILLYGMRVMDTPALQLPHPRILERTFVMRPLVEIAPDERHPITHRRLAEHLESATGLKPAKMVAPASSMVHGEVDESDVGKI